MGVTYNKTKQNNDKKSEKQEMQVKKKQIRAKVSALFLVPSLAQALPTVVDSRVRKTTYDFVSTVSIAKLFDGRGYVATLLTCQAPRQQRLWATFDRLYELSIGA